MSLNLKTKQIIYGIFSQVIEVIRHPHDKVESKYNTDPGISKEDEERYQKLLLENEELQRLIVQVCFFFIYLFIV